jgi:hypothetical protein
MRRTSPRGESLVHDDACPPNIIVGENGSTGYIDLVQGRDQGRRARCRYGRPWAAMITKGFFLAKDKTPIEPVFKVRSGAVGAVVCRCV